MDNISCITKIKAKLNQYDKNVRFVDIIFIDDIKYIIKKEIIKEKIMYEYLFYKKFSKLIKKYKFNIFLNIPLKLLTCVNSYIYLFNFIEYDFNKTYISKLNFNDWLDYTIQLCIIIYFLNHKLKMFHNDINELRNIMIKDNNIPFIINIDNLTYKINNNYIVLIDFGQAQNKQTFTTVNFYYFIYKTFKIEFKFISEVLLAFFYCNYFFLLNNNKNVDIKFNIKAQEYFIYLYHIFNTQSNNTLYDFDFNIITSLIYCKHYFNNI